MKRKGKIYGYVRVSKDDQRPRMQIDLLRAMGCDRIFQDKVSAVGKARPGFEKVLRVLKPCDTLMVYRLDRAFRSTIDAINTREKLRAEGKHLAIATLGLISDTPEGRHFYREMASYAEMERDIISLRTKDGMAAAKRRGAKIGRPRKLPLWQVKRAHERVKRGVPISRAARSLRVSHDTLVRAFDRLARAR